MSQFAPVGRPRRSPARTAAPVDSGIRDCMLRSLQKASDVSTLSVARQELMRLIDGLQDLAYAKSFAVILSQTTSLQPLLMRKTTFLLLDRFFERKADLAAPSFSLLLAYMCKRMSDPEITQQSYYSQISSTFGAFARLAAQCGRSQYLFDYLSFQIRKQSIQTQITALNALSEVIAARPQFENTAAAGELCVNVAAKLHDGVRYSLQFSALRCLSSLMDLGYENANLPRIALKSLELRYFRSRAAAYVILEKAVLLDYFKHRVDEAKQIFVQIQRRKYDQVADVRIAAFRACYVFRELLYQIDPIWVYEVASRSASRSGSRDGTERVNFRDFRDRIAISSRSPATHTLGNVTDPEDDVYDFSGYRQREERAYSAQNALEGEVVARTTAPARYVADSPQFGYYTTKSGAAVYPSAQNGGDYQISPPEIELSTAAPPSQSVESAAKDSRLESQTASAGTASSASETDQAEENADLYAEAAETQSATTSTVSARSSAGTAETSRNSSGSERWRTERRDSAVSSAIVSTNAVNEPMECLALEPRAAQTKGAAFDYISDKNARQLAEKINYSDNDASRLLHSADVQYFGDLPVNLYAPPAKYTPSAQQYQMPQFVGDIFSTPTRRQQFCDQGLPTSSAGAACRPGGGRLSYCDWADGRPGSYFNSKFNDVSASPMPIWQARGTAQGFQPSRPSSAAAFLAHDSGRGARSDATSRELQYISGGAGVSLQSSRTPRTNFLQQDYAKSRAGQAQAQAQARTSAHLTRTSLDASPTFYQTSNASVVAHAEARRGELNQSYATMLFRSEAVPERRLREEALRLMNRTGPCLNTLDDDIVVQLAECVIGLIDDGFIDQMLPWIHQLMQKRHLLALEHAARILGGLGQIWSAHPRWHDVEQLKREIWLYYPQLEEQ